MSTKEEKLAREIAVALDDIVALPIYEKFTKKYSEGFLRKILQKTLSVPEKDIRKTRGALFTYLVNQNYGQGASRD
jgi:hypothetical protein